MLIQLRVPPSNDLSHRSPTFVMVKQRNDTQSFWDEDFSWATVVAARVDD